MSTTERAIDVTIGKWMRTFPFGLSYLISHGRSESPGVTVVLLAVSIYLLKQDLTGVFASAKSDVQAQLAHV